MAQAPSITITVHMPAQEVSEIEAFARGLGLSRATLFKTAVREFIASKKLALPEEEVGNKESSSL